MRSEAIPFGFEFAGEVYFHEIEVEIVGFWNDYNSILTNLDLF